MTRLPTDKAAPGSLSPSRLRGLRGAVLSWYDAHRRRLPWREKTSPYRTWVSEIMLQQTQVATVVPYFERFMARFPDVASLARARESEVLRLWAGLGYYSRARNLLSAAREIASRHGGRLPPEPDVLRSLPGVGAYTAAAVASIAFDGPYAVVDGNVERVLSRLSCLRGDPKRAPARGRLEALAGRLLDPRRPGDWNQAVMELGALVCLPPPDRPACGSCPVARLCLARRRGLAARLPDPSPKKASVALSWTALWIERGGRVLLWKRADDERFLPGHWGLPEARHLPGAAPGALLRRVRHGITHHRIALSVREASLPDKLAGGRWTRREALGRLLVSSLWRKAAGLVLGPAHNRSER